MFCIAKLHIEWWQQLLTLDTVQNQNLTSELAVNTGTNKLELDLSLVLSFSTLNMLKTKYGLGLLSSKFMTIQYAMYYLIKYSVLLYINMSGGTAPTSS